MAPSESTSGSPFVSKARRWPNVYQAWEACYSPADSLQRNNNEGKKSVPWSSATNISSKHFFLHSLRGMKNKCPRQSNRSTREKKERNRHKKTRRPPMNFCLSLLLDKQDNASCQRQIQVMKGTTSVSWITKKRNGKNRGRTKRDSKRKKRRQVLTRDTTDLVFALKKRERATENKRKRDKRSKQNNKKKQRKTSIDASVISFSPFGRKSEREKKRKAWKERKKRKEEEEKKIKS